MNTLKVPLWIIVLIVALPQLSETIYTPSLPEVAVGLNTSDSMAEYTLTSYFIGFAFGTLFWGRLSDRIGRRPGLFWGLAIYMVSSIGCYLSGSIEMLLFMRFLQAFGASVGSVLGQAIARDAIQPEERGKVFSKVSIAMAFAPAIGPVIGGFFVNYTHWSNIFLLLCALAAMVFAQIFMFLPETHPSLGGEKKRINFLDCIKLMMKDCRLLGLGFIVGGVNGILFGYFAESPFYFIESFGLTSSEFGILSFVICLPLAVGGFVSKKMNSRNFKSDEIIEVGIFCIIIGAAIFCCFVYMLVIDINEPGKSLMLSMCCIFITMVGVTMIIPNCIGQALERYGDFAGTAASIFGFYYYLIISIMTAIMGAMHDGTLRALPIFFLTVGISMLLIFKSLVKKFN